MTAEELAREYAAKMICHTEREINGVYIGFLTGHASRDEEVERLKVGRDTYRELADKLSSKMKEIEQMSQSSDTKSDTTKLQDDAQVGNSHNRQDDAGNTQNSADVYKDVYKDAYKHLLLDRIQELEHSLELKQNIIETYVSNTTDLHAELSSLRNELLTIKNLSKG